MDTNGIAVGQLDVSDCISGGCHPYLDDAKAWNNEQGAKSPFRFFIVVFILCCYLG